MTTELFESSELGCTLDEIPHEAVDTCAADCKQLQTTDYMDLLWTTLAEFPGNFMYPDEPYILVFIAFFIFCCLFCRFFSFFASKILFTVINK